MRRSLSPPPHGPLRARLLVGLLAAVALLAAGCSSGGFADGPGTGRAGAASDSAAYAAYSGLAGQERTDRLVADAAEQGGELDVYTSNTDIQSLVDGFQAAYPGIKVNAFRANSETVLQRVLQETSAGRAANDVVDTNDFELRALAEQDVFADYDGPAKADLRPEAVFEGWQAERFNAFVIGWNSDQVSAAEAPRTFTDLTDPKWRGRIAVELGDWDWYASMHTYLTQEKGMTPEQVDEVFRQVVANARVTKGHTVQGELLSAGQFAVAASVYSHTIDNAAADGAPVAWQPIADPVILRPNGFGLMAEPRHPAAALLWADWVLTEGQKVIAASNRIPAVEGVPGADSPMPADAPVYNVPGEVVADSAGWTTRYDDLLRGVPQSG